MENIVAEEDQNVKRIEEMFSGADTKHPLFLYNIKTLIAINQGFSIFSDFFLPCGILGIMILPQHYLVKAGLIILYYLLYIAIFQKLLALLYGGLYKGVEMMTAGFTKIKYLIWMPTIINSIIAAIVWTMVVLEILSILACIYFILKAAWPLLTKGVGAVTK